MRKCRHVGKDTKAKWANSFIRSNSFVRSFSSLTCCCWFWRLKRVLELITAVMVTSSHICATGEVMTACSSPQCAFHSLWLPSTIASCTRFCLIDWEHEFALSPSGTWSEMAVDMPLIQQNIHWQKPQFMHPQRRDEKKSQSAASAGIQALSTWLKGTQVCQKACSDRRSLSCTIPCETLEKQKPSGGNSAHSDISNIEDVCLIYRLYLGVFGQLGWGIGVLIKDNIKSSYWPTPPPNSPTHPHPGPLPHGQQCNSYKSVGKGESRNPKKPQVKQVRPDGKTLGAQLHVPPTFSLCRFIQSQAHWRACILILS